MRFKGIEIEHWGFDAGSRLLVSPVTPVVDHLRPLLTIAAITFRRPIELRACLESVAPQLEGFQNCEFIVVDNDPSGSARSAVEQFGRGVRYIHESRPGVSRARNTAVRESLGAYIGFIDDDETAEPGWLQAMFAHIDRGADASFGIVLPHLAVPVDIDVGRVLIPTYTRNLELGDFHDISRMWTKLGTGNSLFKKSACFVDQDPFPLAFNATGGEDVSLIKSLVQRGIVLRWNPYAVVIEKVPAERTLLRDLHKRRLRQGQQRVLLMAQNRSYSAPLMRALWMGLGLAQFLYFSTRSGLERVRRRPSWRSTLVHASGGLGKLLWWKLNENAAYAKGEDVDIAQ